MEKQIDHLARHVQVVVVVEGCDHVAGAGGGAAALNRVLQACHYVGGAWNGGFHDVVNLFDSDDIAFPPNSISPSMLVQQLVHCCCIHSRNHQTLERVEMSLMGIDEEERRSALEEGHHFLFGVVVTELRCGRDVLVVVVACGSDGGRQDVLE